MSKRNQSQEYLTVREVADTLRVTPATVVGWVKRGRLRAIPLLKGYRIKPVDLDAFLAVGTGAHQ